MEHRGDDARRGRVHLRRRHLRHPQPDPSIRSTRCSTTSAPVDREPGNLEARGAGGDQEGPPTPARSCSRSTTRPARVESGRIVSRLVGDSVPGPEQAVDHRRPRRARWAWARTSSGCERAKALRGQGRARQRRRARDRSGGRARAGCRGRVGSACVRGTREQVEAVGREIRRARARDPEADVTDLDSCERAIRDPHRGLFRTADRFSRQRRGYLAGRASAPNSTTSPPGGRSSK